MMLKTRNNELKIRNYDFTWLSLEIRNNDAEDKKNNDVENKN